MWPFNYSKNYTVEGAWAKHHEAKYQMLDLPELSIPRSWDYSVLNIPEQLTANDLWHAQKLWETDEAFQHDQGGAREGDITGRLSYDNPAIHPVNS